MLDKLETYHIRAIEAGQALLEHTEYLLKTYCNGNIPAAEMYKHDMIVEANTQASSDLLAYMGTLDDPDSTSKELVNKLLDRLDDVIEEVKLLSDQVMKKYNNRTGPDVNEDNRIVEITEMMGTVADNIAERIDKLPKP